MAKVRHALAQRMRYHDRVCFASHATLASDTQLSVRTVKRCLERLGAAGEIERLETLPNGRRVRTCVWRFARGERRLPRKWPTTPYGRKPQGTTPNYVRSGAMKRQRWRCGMGELALVGGDGAEVALPQEVRANHVMAVIADAFGAEGIPLARRARGILARQSKELLEDGFAPTVVARACIVAERRGEPHNAWRIAGDIVRVEKGLHMTRADYERELKAELAPGPSALLLQMMEERGRQRGH